MVTHAPRRGADCSPSDPVGALGFTQLSIGFETRLRCEDGLLEYNPLKSPGT